VTNRTQFHVLRAYVDCCFACAGMDVYTESLAVFERNYPETLRKTYVLNGMVIHMRTFTLLPSFFNTRVLKV